MRCIGRRPGVPASASSVLIHVRDFTKGHPDVEANNHPIRHGSVVGVHNGVLSNDDDLLARYGIERHDPAMTVDSEAIFALMELRRNDAGALSEIRGSMAAGWIDEREPDAVFLARGVSRPLWIGRTRTEQRWRENASGTSWRARQMLRGVMPLGKPGAPSAIVTSEVFFELADTRWGVRSGLDQVRTFAGVGIPLKPGLSTEIGYLNQTLIGRDRPGPNHIAQITLVARF